MRASHSNNGARKGVLQARAWVGVALALAAVFCTAGVWWWDAQRAPVAVAPVAVVPAKVEPRPPASGPPWFDDLTATAGLHFTYRNGEEADQFAILESLGGGVALIDYDGDGLLDIFLTGGGYFDGPEHTIIKGYPCKLFRNLGGWKFTDVTKEAGLDLPWDYTHGVAVADYDRDGWPDLLVTSYGRLRLLHNEANGTGGRRFVDVTETMGLEDRSWCTSAGWADLDGDGWPDLYVCHYVDWSFANHPVCLGRVPGIKRDICGPESFKPLRHALYRNERGKAFQDVSATHGFRAVGCGLGVVLADLNDDARPDIYVANDTNNNLLFLNRGGLLEERGLASGAAIDEHGKANGSMGVDVGDFDGSGRPSLWVTTFQGELFGLYRNLGQETFRHHARAAGIAALGQQLVGFGSAFVDVDNDGWEDLVSVNGHVFRAPPGNQFKQRPLLLRNGEYRGRRWFEDIGAQGGAFFQTPTVGRGLAIGDLDNDGWPDLVVSSNNSSVALLRNAARQDMASRWLGVKLAGKDFRDVVGSTVILEGSTRKLTRFAKGGGSYLSASDPRILFGLGKSELVRRVTVKWSWGQVQTWDWTGRDVNAYWELCEDQAEPRRVTGAVK